MWFQECVLSPTQWVYLADSPRYTWAAWHTRSGLPWDSYVDPLLFLGKCAGKTQPCTLCGHLLLRAHGHRIEHIHLLWASRTCSCWPLGPPPAVFADSVLGSERSHFSCIRFPKSTTVVMFNKTASGFVDLPHYPRPQPHSLPTRAGVCKPLHTYTSFPRSIILAPGRTLDPPGSQWYLSSISNDRRILMASQG